MQNISQRRHLHSIVHGEPASPAPNFGAVPNKPAIIQPADFASEIAAQTNSRTVNPYTSESDRVASPAFAAGLVILLAILYALAWFAPKL